MNHAKQPRLNPSETELRASVLNSISEIITTPDIKDIAKGEWVTATQMAEHLGISYDSAEHRLRRKTISGYLERKSERCKVNGKTVLTNLYKVKINETK